MNPMIFNNFSVRVSPGREVGDGYVVMRHGDVYTLTLHNYRDVRCDATVEVDARNVGTWRIEARSSITLERPSNDTGRFTFYQSGSSEFSTVGGEAIPQSERGLIRVTFTPELPPAPISPVSSVKKDLDNTGWTPPYRTYGESGWSSSEEPPVAMAAMPTYSSGVTQSRSASPGITGLSGKSNQTFLSVASLNYDYSRQITIYLRLIADDETPRPVVSVSTPVPPPI